MINRLHITRDNARELTGIRGVAALWVAIFHMGDLIDQTKPLEQVQLPVIRSGYLAVDLFFVLSGFILAANYVPAMGTNFWSAAKKFAIGRVFRIMPLNVFTLSVFLVAVTALGKAKYTSEGLDSSSFVAALFLVQSWGFWSPTAWNAPSWSLSTEWFAYLWFPAAAILAARTHSKIVGLIAVVLPLVLLALVLSVLSDGTLNHVWRLGMVRCVLEFAAGLGLWRFLSLTGIGPGASDASFVCGIAILSIALFEPSLEVLAPFAFALFVAACSGRGRIVRVAFASRAVVGLGEISFSIYLLHHIIIRSFAFWKDPTAGLTWSLALPTMAMITVLTVSYVTWRLIEMPGQKFGRVIADHATGPHRLPRLSEPAP